MKELLTKEELDTLLGDEAAAGPAPANLLKPNRVAPGHRALVCEIQREIGRLIAVRLSARLRTDVEAKAAQLEQVRFADWCRQLAGVHTFLGFELRPFARPCVLALENGFLYAAVERILGGSGRLTSSTRPILTEAELTVAEAVWTPVVDCIARGFQRLCEVTVEVRERAATADAVVTLPPQETMLAFEYAVHSSGAQGNLRLGVPLGSVVPHLPALAGTGGQTPETLPARQRLSHRLRQVDTELSVIMSVLEVPLREILGLQVGDVMQLPANDEGDQARASVQGRVKFHGRIGSIGSGLGFRVDTVLSDTSADVEETHS